MANLELKANRNDLLPFVVALLIAAHVIAFILYSVHLAPDNLPLGIACLLGDEVGEVALLILHEKRLGKKSEWAPYISRLPPLPKDMHSLVFWSDEEMDMVRQMAIAGCGFAPGDEVLIMESFRMPHSFWISVLLFLAIVMIKFMLSLVHLNMMLSIRRSWIYSWQRSHTPRIKDDNEFAYYDNKSASAWLESYCSTL
ncbi:hypothetical protein SASPL_151049 [Salvia splendens]|uniref:Uncharacterized protein n=1 Tax=Salvia splendens TaxID=180675 RepID=A0A8X8Z312_SALSN|nr:hypothetical protein SASPL_151049 [Salvia splendens]